MKAIEIKNLKKKYGKLEAIKGITLSINEGDFFGFLGPNGAGKTTTIHSITGIAKYDSGTITVMGNDVIKNYREARKNIGLSEQEVNIDPYFSIKEVLIFQAGYYGIPRKEALPKVEQILTKLKLKEKQNQIIRSLSGGMKRRLSIAMALIHNPKILILDEPTSGVDVELRHEIWNYLKELNKEGKTIILTTHYIEEAEKLCNKIAIINKGKIIINNTTKKIMNQIKTNKITLTTTKPITKIPKTLKKYNTNIEKNKIKIKTLNAEKELLKIIYNLKKEGIKIKNFKIEKKTLENIFLKLTK